MKCPLFYMGYQIVDDKGKPELSDCIREECAWWMKLDGQCAIYGLALYTMGTNTTMKMIEDKMPHELQFRPKP